MIGCRFRLQGIDAASGLDCVGLICAAYRAVGVELAALAPYPIRGWSAKKICAHVAINGLTPRPRRTAPQIGDIAMMSLPAAQIHFALVGDVTIIHAHAGLRRVVESPIDFLQPPLRYWYWP